MDVLPKIRKPIVWTFRDMWPMTGGCHYTLSCNNYKKTCGNCPQLNSNEKHDLSYFSQKKKIKIVKKIHSGGKGELRASDIPKASLDKFEDGLKDGFDSAPNWDNYCNLYTKKHDKINRSITDNIIEVFTPKGRRRSKSSIVNDIIKKLV
jgi:hypothetical protein